MPGSEGLLLKWSTSSYRKQILSVLYYGKVLDFYESTTLIKYLLWWIRSRKCTRNNLDIIYILQKSLYSTKNYIIRDLFLWVSWQISCSLILESKWFPSLQWLDSSLHPVKHDCFPQSTYFALEWQSVRVVQRFDPRRLVFYSTRAIGLEGRE